MRLLPIFTVLFLVPAASTQGSFVECTDVIHLFQGEAVGDSFGWVSSPIPDVTGDGAPELLVSAPFHSSVRNLAGRVYLYDGATGVELFRVDGPRAQDQLGFSVRDAGDVDMDGIEDVIVGGRGSPTTAGVALVLSGLDGSIVHEIRLGAPNDFFGYSVSGMGDVDGDFIPDLAVGAPQDATAGPNAGKVVVLSGADGTTVLRTYLGSAGGETFGTALARLGDLNGDGVAEMLVGAANAGGALRGRAYVFDLASDVELYRVDPNASGSEFGQFFVASAGLVDADAVPDFYVSDFADGGGRGRAYLYSGATGARIRVLTGQAGDGFGIGRPMGDVNGDGADDILLGSWTNSSGALLAGQAEIFSGADGSLLRRVTSATAGEAFGFDAHGLGDVDGDGEPEMVVTAANFQNSRGRVYVIGSAPTASFGVALAGSAGIEPTLALGGDCPRPGNTLSLDVQLGFGGALGTLVLGTKRIDLPFRGGTLYPDPGFLRFVHRLNGAVGVAGDGTIAIPLPVPANPVLVGLDLYAQGLWLDAAAPMGVSMTAGLRFSLY